MTAVLTDDDRAMLATLGKLLEQECAILVTARVDVAALHEITEAKAAAIEALRKTRAECYRSDPAVLRQLWQLRMQNRRNGRILAIRRSANQRVLDAIADTAGRDLYDPSGRVA